MAGGSLTFEEFWNLPTEKDRSERYVELSDHDKFRVRMSMPPGATEYIPCNECVHRIAGKPACKAFPDGLSAEHIRAVMDDQMLECGKGYHFERRKN